jgi:hypothetical protein
MEATKISKTGTEPFQLSLRIRHPSLDPADISRELGMEPQHCFRAGDPRPSRTNLTPPTAYAESYWLGALDPGEWPMPMAVPEDPRLEMVRERLGVVATSSLGWALSLSTRFFGAHAAMLRRIRTEGGQVSLLATVPMGEIAGFSVTPEVSRVFGDLGIAIEFEFTND